MNGAYIELARMHAPLLLLTIPLTGALLAALAPGARLAWAIAIVAALAGAAVGVDLAWRVLVLGAQSAPTQEAIALHADGVGAWACALVAVFGALSVIAAGAPLRGDFHPRAAPLAVALLLTMIAGWSGAALARDFVTMFAAVETAWLASVGLVALSAERERGALTGALRMLVSGGVASALMLVGIGLAARGAGHVDLTLLASAPVTSAGLTTMGLALVLAALALKAGVAPLHLWIASAYGRAGGVPALALGAIGSAAALLVLVRVAAFAMSAPTLAPGLSAVILALGLASMVIGSVQAIGARNLRRLVAYASVAQAGCVLISAALGSSAGFAAALVQVLAQSGAALALLAGGASLAGARSMNGLDGLARRAPLAAIAITAGALSLMGAPLTLGFLGRWRLIEAGVGGGWWWAASAVIITSLAAVLYGGRLVERIYFRRAAETGEAPDIWRVSLWPALAAAIAATALGLEPSLVLRAADAAAVMPIGGAP